MEGTFLILYLEVALPPRAREEYSLFKPLGISVLPLTPTGLEASSPSLHGKTGAPNYRGPEAPSVTPRRQSLRGWWGPLQAEVVGQPCPSLQ